MKAVVIAFVMLFGAASTVRAQQSDAAIVARFREHPGLAQRAPERCVNKPVLVLASTALGAVAGWFVFTFGIGILADDHGDLYYKTRNQFMLGGAVLMGGLALFDALTQDCIQAHPRRR